MASFNETLLSSCFEKCVIESLGPDLKERINSFDKELELLEIESKQTIDRRENEIKNLVKIELENENLQQKIHELELKLSKCTNELKSLNQLVDSTKRAAVEKEQILKEQAEDLKAKLDEAKTNLKTTNAQLFNSQLNNFKLNSETIKTTQLVSELKAENTRLNSINEGNSLLIAVLTSANEENKLNEESLKKTIESLTENCMQLNKQANEIKAENEYLKNQQREFVASLNQENELKLNEAFKEFEKKIFDFEQTLCFLKTENNSLKVNNKSLEDNLLQVKSEKEFVEERLNTLQNKYDQEILSKRKFECLFNINFPSSDERKPNEFCENKSKIAKVQDSRKFDASLPSLMSINLENDK